jgi:hypothetical protein
MSVERIIHEADLKRSIRYLQDAHIMFFEAQTHHANLVMNQLEIEFKLLVETSHKWKTFSRAIIPIIHSFEHFRKDVDDKFKEQIGILERELRHEEGDYSDSD